MAVEINNAYDSDDMSSTCTNGNGLGSPTTSTSRPHLNLRPSETSNSTVQNRHTPQAKQTLDVIHEFGDDDHPRMLPTPSSAGDQDSDIDDDRDDNDRDHENSQTNTHSIAGTPRAQVINDDNDDNEFEIDVGTNTGKDKDATGSRAMPSQDFGDSREWSQSRTFSRSRSSRARISPHDQLINQTVYDLKRIILIMFLINLIYIAFGIGFILRNEMVTLIFWMIFQLIALKGKKYLQWLLFFCFFFCFFFFFLFCFALFLNSYQSFFFFIYLTRK